MIDTEKLEGLRVDHATFHQQYTIAANRALELGREGARIRAEIQTASEFDGPRIAAMSLERLSALPDVVINESGTPPRLVRRLIDVERRMAATRRDAEGMAGRLRRRRVLLDRLEQYAQQFPEN